MGFSDPLHRHTKLLLDYFLLYYHDTVVKYEMSTYVVGIPAVRGRVKGESSMKACPNKGLTRALDCCSRPLCALFFMPVTMETLPCRLIIN